MIELIDGLPENILAIRAAGLDADSILAASQHPDVKASLIANTESAVARGVFGVPTLFIGQQMFFGQDRFQFVEMALQD